MSVQRWAERDGKRLARRFVHAILSGDDLDTGELAYMRAMTMALLLTDQADDETAEHMRMLLNRLEAKASA